MGPAIVIAGEGLGLVAPSKETLASMGPAIVIAGETVAGYL